MRVLLFANNWGGWQVTHWMMERGEDIVGIITHPSGNSKFRDQILWEFVDAYGCAHFDADFLQEQNTVREIAKLRPDIGVTAFFGYILKPDIIDIPPKGIVNLHTGYLPHNKGWHPNVYPFIDDSPPGVTIHYVDESIDGGDMIAWRYVKLEPYDTGGTLHQRLTRTLLDLFKETWPSIKAGEVERTKQNGKGHKVHLRREMRELERIDLDKEYPARYLIGLLRGLTYPPYAAAYFEENGKRIYVRVELFGDEHLTGGLPEWD